MKNILIIGLGNIGSRYLQGTKKYNKKLNIFGLDCSIESLNNANERWKEVTVSDHRHNLNLIQNYDQIPKEIHLAIISTTADIRLKIIKEISENFTIHAWILEKVLVQSPLDLDDLEKYFLDVNAVWVNCGYRAMPMHQKLHDVITTQSPIDFRGGSGNWGLACNSVHFLDLINWWTDENLLKIDTSNLDKNWFESKRQGFWEVTGTLKAIYSNGSKLSLKSSRNCVYKNFPVKAKSAEGEWITNDFTEGIIKGPNGLSLPILEERLSDLSAKIVKSILENGICDLTKLKDAVYIHRIFLLAMLEHWNENYSRHDNYLPIT